MSQELLEIEFEYNFKPNPEQIEILQKIRNKFKQKYKQEVALQDDGTLAWDCREFLCTASDVIALKIPFTVKYATGLMPVPDREEFFTKHEVIPYNLKVNTIVTSGTLLKINEVVNHNDLCTERLQQLLSEGWHIIAVCPQPDQRRPDYILGRHE